MFVGKKMVSSHTYLGVFFVVPSVFSRQQQPVDFTGEVFHSQKNGPTDFGKFCRLKLEKPSSHKENTSEGESFQSLLSVPAQELAEGLEGLLNLPFLENSTKRTRFEAYQDSSSKQVIRIFICLQY